MDNSKPPKEGKSFLFYLLKKIIELLIELVKKTKRPVLKYKGKEIIPIERIAIDLNLSPRTIQRYRAKGAIEYYVSQDGHTIFVTEDQFDAFIESYFTLSTELRKDKHPSG